jgi:hypothetical protein
MAVRGDLPRIVRVFAAGFRGSEGRYSGSAFLGQQGHPRHLDRFFSDFAHAAFAAAVTQSNADLFEFGGPLGG